MPMIQTEFFVHCLDSDEWCGHNHNTLKAAEKCAKKLNKLSLKRKDHRSWEVSLPKFKPLDFVRVRNFPEKKGEIERVYPAINPSDDWVGQSLYEVRFSGFNFQEKRADVLIECWEDELIKAED